MHDEWVRLQKLKVGKEIELYPVSYKSYINVNSKRSHKSHNKFCMSPERLSKIIRESNPFINAGWPNLIGKLITCPLCGRKAVIVPYGIELPVEKPFGTPCHCAISLATGDVICHWCVTDECCDKRNHYYPSSYIRMEDYDMNTDVCSAVRKIMKTSYKV